MGYSSAARYFLNDPLFMKPLKILSRAILQNEVGPLLVQAIATRHPMTEKETRTVASFYAIVACLTQNGVTTAGAVIDSVLYPDRDALPLRTNSRTSALNRLRKNIDALFLCNGVNVTCHLSRDNALGNARPLSFRQTDKNLYTPQTRDGTPRPLSGHEVLCALASAFDKKPSTGKGARRIARLTFALVMLSAKNGAATGGDLLSTLYPHEAFTHDRATRLIGAWRRATNRLFQTTGIPVALAVDTQRNAGLHRKFYFIGAYGNDKRAAASTLPLPRNGQEMDKAFLQFLSRYAR